MGCVSLWMNLLGMNKQYLSHYVYVCEYVWVGAQMGGPICHRSKVPIYSKSWLDFGNYN